MLFFQQKSSDVPWCTHHTSTMEMVHLQFQSRHTACWDGHREETQKKGSSSHHKTKKYKTHTHTHTCARMCAHTHMRVRTHMHTYTRMCMHVYTHTYTHTHTHTHKHIHTHTQIRETPVKYVGHNTLMYVSFYPIQIND